MDRDDVLNDNERRTGLIKATSIVGSAGLTTNVPFIASLNPGSDVLAKVTTELDPSGIPAGKMRAILFAISLVTFILAFNNGPSFIGMFFVLVSISCFGYGFGSIMNSYCPKRRD